MAEEHRFYSADVVPVARGLDCQWQVGSPRLRIGPMAPVLEGRLLTTGPPGKSKIAIPLNLNSFG